MRILTVTVDMDKLTKYTLEEVPEIIDQMLKPHHLKWCFNNIYIVENGYDEDLAIDNAIIIETIGRIKNCLKTVQGLLIRL